MPILSKLLSHRIRGFAPNENSREALIRITRTRIPYIEIDTRATSDGRIVVYHSPRLGAKTTHKRRLIRNAGAAIDKVRYRDGEPLLFLEQALEIFSAREDPAQKLCIDIKDHGFEREHLDLVQRFGLESNVVLLSWIPQTITRLAALAPGIPLILAHVNLMRLGPGGRWLERALAGAMFRMAWFVVLGKRKWDALPRKYRHSFQHALVASTLPEPLTDLLHSSGGGICVHKSMLCPALLADCRRRRIRLWVFSVNSTRAFLRLAEKPDVDVIFANNAARVYRECQAKRPDGED